MFIIYNAKVENQVNKNIKILNSDRGGEYESNEFSELYANFSIIHQSTTPYTPQQNEIAEKNRTLKDMVNSMLISFGAPQNLWREALLTINYILNRAPQNKLDFIPFKLWHGRRLPTITSRCGGVLQSYWHHYLKRLVGIKNGLNFHRLYLE